MEPMNTPLLEVSNLSVDFKLPERRIAHAVRNVSFAIAPGERVALVGESGSGKSTVANAAMRIEDPGELSEESRVVYAGQVLTDMRESKLRLLRGSEISRIPQYSNNALNPVQTVGAQIIEAIRAHRKVSKDEAHDRAVSLLQDVQIPNAATKMSAYPHQFSGGMQQRVFIAMALAAEPKLLIADEPTTALDVSVQAEVLEMLDAQVTARNMALLLITHDLAIVAGRCDRVLVMYGGRLVDGFRLDAIKHLVEEGSVEEIFSGGAHPYSRDLLASLSRIDAEADNAFPSIPGSPPDPAESIIGCPYRLRGCAFATDACSEELPKLTVISDSRRAACHMADEVMEENGEQHAV